MKDLKRFHLEDIIRHMEERLNETYDPLKPFTHQEPRFYTLLQEYKVKVRIYERERQ